MCQMTLRHDFYQMRTHHGNNAYLPTKVKRKAGRMLIIQLDIAYYRSGDKNFVSGGLGAIELNTLNVDLSTISLVGIGTDGVVIFS